MPDLARRDQVLDRAGDLLDRHVGIDPVLIEEVDRFDPQALQRRLGDLLDPLGPAVQARQGFAPPGSRLKPNLVAITTLPRKGSSASPTSSSLVQGP